MRFVGWAAAALLLWSAEPAMGHEGGIDVRGVVVTADAEHVTVRGANGKEVRFALTPETRILVGNRAARPADLKSGVRAVVHGRKVGEHLQAVSIRASPLPSSGPALPRG